jgi:hypothetical protein
VVVVSPNNFFRSLFMRAAGIALPARLQALDFQFGYAS